MSVTKAIITTAGFGTRFLPISKTIQKEMLPILNRPLVDYVVDDLIAAGVTEIIFVISEHNSQVKHYYQENLRLYDYLDKMSKKNLYEKVQEIHKRANFTFVNQRDVGQYGTAVPVKISRRYLENEEAFFVFSGDDFLYNNQGISEAQKMIELWQQTKAGGIATFVEMPGEKVHRYGVAAVENEDGVDYLQKLVEKPKPGSAPSNLANISKYLLTPEIFEVIEEQKVDPESGELYITDSVEELARRSKVAIYKPRGEYLDGGNEVSWLQANLRVAQDHPEFSDVLESLQ